MPEDTGKQAADAKADDTKQTDASDGGQKADAGIPPEEVNALRSELVELRRERDKRKREDEARAKQELEAQGKHKELIETQMKTIEELEAKVKMAERRDALRLEIAAFETSFNKDWLFEEVDLRDHVSGRDGDIKALIKATHDKLLKILPEPKTQGFGATGGGSSSGKLENDFAALEALWKKGQTDPTSNRRFIMAQAEYLEKHPGKKVVVRDGRLQVTG